MKILGVAIISGGTAKVPGMVVYMAENSVLKCNLPIRGWGCPGIPDFMYSTLRDRYSVLL